MDKAKLVEQIIAQLEQDLASIKSAALATYAAATGEESKPENEYDTRALEASYLAGAQAKRVVETEGSLLVFQNLKLRKFDSSSTIESTAVVDLKLEDKSLTVFLAPARGSITVVHEGRSIQVITPQSPLGEALLGLKVGDCAIVEKGQRRLEYEILGLI
jgi:hypothetical protein